MTKLAEWTNAWFIRPSSCGRPSADEDLWIFVSLVSLLGPESKESDLRIVHAYFTYLLLRCDPFVGTPVGPTEVKLDPYDERLFKGLLDFTKPNDPSPRWNALIKFMRLSNKALTYTDEEMRYRVLLTLALTLLAKPKPPAAPVFIRKCLELYQRSLEFETTLSFKTEFLASTPMLYSVWLHDFAEQAFIIGTHTVNEVMSLISYAAWYCNLIRATRMFRAVSDSRSTTFGVVDSALKEQVQMLQRSLDTLPLKADDTTPSHHLLDLFGIKPKKKVK